MATPVPAALKRDRELRRIVLAGIALLCLAGASWGLAHARLGAFAAPTALGIACVKAFLVALVFMRLANSSVASRAALGVALGFIALLSAGVLSDVLLR